MKPTPPLSAPFFYFRGDTNLRIERSMDLGIVLAAIKGDEVRYRTGLLAEKRALHRSLGVKKWWHG